MFRIVDWMIEELIISNISTCAFVCRHENPESSCLN